MTASLEERLASVEAELAAVRDAAAIESLMYRYIEACDHIHDPDLIASFFAEDAVWEGAGRYQEWGTSHGRQAIIDQFAGTPDILGFTVHWLTNPVVTVDADRSRATGRWEVIQAATFSRTDTAVWVGARYDNEFVRTEAGWLIQHLRYADVFVTPFDEGWARTPYRSPFATAATPTPELPS